MGENIHGSGDVSLSFMPDGPDAEFSDDLPAVSGADMLEKVTHAVTPRSSMPIRSP